MSKLTGRQLDWLLRLLLVGAVAAVFWPVLQANFVSWDDGLNITENPNLGLRWKNLCWMFTDISYVPRYMPLGWFSYSVDRAFFHTSALSYHAGNMLLHSLNTLLLYAIIKQVLAFWARGGEAGSLPRQCAAAAGALWWSVNPLRTEPVAWASSRIYCVAALFFFFSVWIYMRQQGAINQPQGSVPVPHNRRAIWLAAVFFALSLFTYPIALGGLAVFVALDFALGRLPLPAGIGSTVSQIKQWCLPPYRSIWLEKLWFLLPALINFFVNWVAAKKGPTFSQGHIGALAHCMQAGWVWAWYAWKSWLPLDLAPKYPDLVGELLFTPKHCAAVLLVLGITGLVILRRRSWPSLLVLWVCYLALLAPFIGVSQHTHYTCDRYSYIAGGIWAAVFAMAILLLMRAKVPRFAIGVTVALLCGVLGFQARQQTFCWNNSLNVHALMAEALGDHREAGQHELHAAYALSLLKYPDEALIRLRRAVVLLPENSDAWAMLGDRFAEENSARRDQAISSYQRALNLNPKMQYVRQQLGQNLALAGRHEEAVTQFTELLRNSPGTPATHRELALSLEKLGRKAEAEKHLETAQALECEVWH